MTMLTILRSCSLATLALGLVVQPMARRDFTATLADPESHTAPRRTPLAAGDSIVLDVSAGLRVLDSLRAGERWEQVADWAVYGTLFESPLTPAQIRGAMYDKTPLRLAGIEAAANLDYGPGRRVLLHDGSVWLFYAADAPRTATLARLADQVRMDRGEIPENFSVFVIRSNLTGGAVVVRREPDIRGSTLFSKEFGYVERTVRSVDDMKSWISETDDLTHVKMIDGGAEIGGRRLAENRTWGITMDDVGALYQAHVTLEAKRSDLLSSKSPTENAFTAVLDAFNAQVRRLNASKYESMETGEIDAAIRRLEATLDSTALLSKANGSEDLEAMLKRLTSPEYTVPAVGLEGYRSRIATMRPRVEAAIQAEHEARVAGFAKVNGWTLAAEPGFSLDPQIDPKARARNRVELLTNVDGLIASARSLAERMGSDTTGRQPSSPDVDAAYLVRTAFRNGEGASFRRLLRALTARDTSFDALAASADYLSQRQIKALLNFVQVRSKVQCARYDGPLNGTHAGMILFYTDLMAKLWSIDYGRSSPVDSVFGFLSALEVGERGEAEPLYWPEADSLSNTRLWFGPKQDAYASREDGNELNFAHIATRVYSAGSDPGSPGKESPTAELNGRDIRWWDQHLAAIGDYEQAYHAQNQIMKWSVVTGLLAKSKRLASLEQVPVVHDNRFDRWYAANPQLRYRNALPILPPERWIGKTECMELLVSPSFHLAGSVNNLIGGVSLGGARTIEEGSRIASSVSPGLRRAGVDYASSGTGEISTLRKVKYQFADDLTASKASVEIKLPEVELPTGKVAPAVRGDGTLFHVDRLGGSVENLEGGARTARIAAGTEDLGSISLRPGRNGTTLAIREGPASFDRHFLRDVAFETAETKDLSRAVAVHADVASNPSTFILRNNNELTVVFGEAEASGGQSRALRLLSGDPPTDGEKWMTTAGAGPLRGGMSREATKLSALHLAYDDAIATVNAAKWQRLSTTAGAGEKPGLVRIFENSGPSDGRTIEIVTGDAKLPSLKARITREAVYLERPASGTTNEAFNRFASDQGLTANQVDQLIAKAQQGVSKLDLTASELRRPPSEIIGDRIIAGDSRGVLRLLARESQANHLDESLTGLRSYVSQQGFKAYKTGRPMGGTDLFMNMDRASATPNDLIYRAIGDVQRRDVAAATADIEAAIRRGAPSPDAIAAADRAFRDAGHSDDIGAFARLRQSRAEGGGGGAGGPGNGPGGGTGRGSGGGTGRGSGGGSTGAPPGFNSEARLVRDGFREHLVLFFDEPRLTKQTLAFRRAHAIDIVQHDVIYVDERTLRDPHVLRERDPDLAPGRFAAEVVQNARIDMSEFVDSRALVLPKKMVVQGHTYVRIDTHATTLLRPQRVWLARSNCNGENVQRDPSCPAA